MSETVFRSKAAVFRWLEENDRQIKKSQFYDHCKDGLLRQVRSGENKGKYVLSAIEKYAKLNVKPAGASQKTNDLLDTMQQETIETKLKREKVKLEKEQRENEISKGRFVAADDFELAIVSRAVVLMSHLNHSFQMSAAEIIDLVKGDQGRGPELVDYLSKLASKRIGEYVADADKEFEVILEANK